ncbi:MAG TPA: competence protein ComE [Cyanothece sp. UBA12306]|nr:competence protein ComE [Cyanothece sp. UBA12306]
MRKFHWLNTIKLSLLIMGLWVLYSCRSTVKIERPKPLPQDPLIQVYFNHNQAQNANYKEPYRNFMRSGDNLEQILIDSIQSATNTIDIAVQEFRLPGVAKALVKQSKKGVEVRIILENNYNFSLSKLTNDDFNYKTEREKKHYQSLLKFIDINNDGIINQKEISNRDTLSILNGAKIPIIDDTADGSKGSGLMHHKFMVIDNKIVITGSVNFTPSGTHGDLDKSLTRGNANNLLKINSAEIARAFTEEFNLMWGDGVGGKLDSKFGVKKRARSPKNFTVGNSIVTLKFSPNSTKDDWHNTTNGLINKTLNRSYQSVDLALFVWSEQKLVNTLEKKHNQGLQIRALVDSEFAFRSYSEVLDILGVALSDNCQYETDNQPWVNPIDSAGVPELETGDKLHHKFAIIDQNLIITGSHNWSQSANRQNDETLLIIENPIIAAHYQREFERLYSNAKLGLPNFLEQKIAKDAQICPSFSTRKSSRHTDKIINLNLASQAELESLPGIGEKIAQKIIEERRQKPFTSLNDLTRVSGIGKSKIKRLEGKVTW